MNTASMPNATGPGVRDRIIEAIAAAPKAWITPSEVASAIGLDTESTLDELAEMDVEGLLDFWEQADSLVVTLSVLTASRLGCRLVEHGPGARLRWARESDPDPTTIRARYVVRSAASSSLDFLVDPRPGPDAEAELSEQAERSRVAHSPESLRRAADRGELPRPTLFIGAGIIPWPGPASVDVRQCPACGSRLLPPHAYCLCCDRWGLDAPIGIARRRARTSRSPDATGFLDPDRRLEAAEQERRHRKERRGQRLAQRFERQRRDRISDRCRRLEPPA